jgi:methyl-accepting chemotaxis protein
MLKNISVSAKGFLAFAILAFIAISASSLIYVRAVSTTELVERSQAMACCGKKPSSSAAKSRSPTWR